MKQEKISKKIENYMLKNDWDFSSDRRMGYHLMHCFHHCFIHDFPKMFQVKPMSSVYTLSDGVTSFFFVKREYENLLRSISQKLETNKKFSIKLTKFIYDRYKMYQRYADSNITKNKQLNNKTVWNILDNNRKIEEKMSAPFWIIFNAFEKLLTDVLIKQGVLQKDLEILAVSAKKVPLDVYKIDLYKTIISNKVNGFEKLRVKYSHLGVFDFMFDQKNVQYHIDQAKGVSIDEAKKRLKELNIHYRRIALDIEKVSRKYKDKAHLINLFKAFADVKEWKNFLREKVNNQLKQPMVYMSNLCNCSLDEVALLTYDEIKDILILGKGSIPHLSNRFKKSVFIFDKTTLYISDDSSTVNNFLEKQRVIGIQQISGTPAFKGNVKGTVKIVIGERDFSKIMEGDVLVSSTTRPDFLPVMKKVVGFITNEGGLLSHAAIVARELKKPCIIGTKIATKVLKDGDYVEVNADTGVVKILKRGN